MRNYYGDRVIGLPWGHQLRKPGRHSSGAIVLELVKRGEQTGEVVALSPDRAKAFAIEILNLLATLPMTPGYHRPHTIQPLPQAQASHTTDNPKPKTPAEEVDSLILEDMLRAGAEYQDDQIMTKLSDETT